MAVLHPIPSASAETAVVVNPTFWRSMRSECFRSASRASIDGLDAVTGEKFAHCCAASVSAILGPIPERPMRLHTFCALTAIVTMAAYAQEIPRVNGSPDRGPGEGDGPFDRMVIRGITMIDGTGAPPRGPVDVVVEKNRIAEIRSVGTPGVPIRSQGRPAKGAKEIDGTGMYIL